MMILSAIALGLRIAPVAAEKMVFKLQEDEKGGLDENTAVCILFLLFKRLKYRGMQEAKERQDTGRSDF